MVSHAMAAIRAALRGTMPCQPKNGRIPRNSMGRNIIRMATTLVTYPINAAMSGMEA
ncbi:hypothetical protein SAMN05661093_03831 [Kibdelosporangium aridum]|uniref:Uncharacterized protein n=1 Tax=Kibdelosporangium aridum TaxID=2030 RepID=A0A1W2DT31_KIBAR|nr:hypothetical protein SAMN05661093_03831 [Kibdelosporangium aridum]